MADEGLNWALTGRFEGIDGRLDGIDRRREADKAEMTALRNELGDVQEANAKIAEALDNLSDSWRALRTALYTFAVLIVGAAATLIVIGRPV